MMSFFQDRDHERQFTQKSACYHLVSAHAVYVGYISRSVRQFLIYNTS